MQAKQHVQCLRAFNWSARPFATLTSRDLSLPKTPRGAIVTSNYPESGECRLRAAARARSITAGGIQGMRTGRWRRIEGASLRSSSVSLALT
jgi:hypothetical protein